MANGLSRVQKYGRLDVPLHLEYLDNDLDLVDQRFEKTHTRFEERFDELEASLRKVFWTAVSLLVAVIAALAGAVIYVGR